MLLHKLAEHHNYWVSYLRKKGCPSDMAEDIVQEMYIKLDRTLKQPERIYYDGGKISFNFVQFCLFNLYRDSLRLNSYKKKDYIDDKEDNNVENIARIGSDLSKKEGLERLMLKINKEISTWNSNYDKILIGLLFDGYKQRQIARETGISLNSIHNSVRHYKSILINKFGEDVEDFFNEDYDKI